MIRVRFGWVLALLLIPPVIVFLSPNEIIGGIALIGWMFVSIPVAILVFVDWVRAPTVQGGRAAQIVRHLSRVPIFILGATAGLMGIVVIGWIAYNVLWDRQPEFNSMLGPVGAIVGILSMLVFIQFGFSLVRLSLQRPRPAAIAHADAHVHCASHRAEILASALCGCFHCLSTFLPAEIEDWTTERSSDGTWKTGETAKCPRCGIDAVIGSASGYPVTPEFLERMNAHWF